MSLNNNLWNSVDNVYVYIYHMKTFKRNLSKQMKEVLILLTLKLKQDINCKVFYKTYLYSLLKDIHYSVNNENSDVKRGGGNINSLFSQLLLLFMTMKTGLASSIIPQTSDSSLQIINKYQLSNNELDDTVEKTKLISLQKVEPYSTWFLTTRENVANHNMNKGLKEQVESLNKHLKSTFKDGTYHLSTTSKITNICRDIFLDNDVEKLLDPENVAPISATYVSSFYSALSPAPTPTAPLLEPATDGELKSPKVDYNSLCETQFPIPRLYIDENNNIQLEITKSISYNKIADMLETLYKSAKNNDLSDDVNVKVSQLKFLIKFVRKIDESVKQNSTDIEKFLNVFYRVQEFFFEFEKFEYQYGDPQLRENVEIKGKIMEFESMLLDEGTRHNSRKIVSTANSYLKPGFITLSAVGEGLGGVVSDTILSITEPLHIMDNIFKMISAGMALLLLYKLTKRDNNATIEKKLSELMNVVDKMNDQKNKRYPDEIDDKKSIQILDAVLDRIENMQERPEIRRSRRLQYQIESYDDYDDRRDMKRNLRNGGTKRNKKTKTKVNTKRRHIHTRVQRK